MEGAAVVAAEEKSLSLHVDVGGVGGKGSDFIGEESGGRVQMLAHTVPHHSSQLLHFFFPHLSSFF